MYRVNEDNSIYATRGDIVFINVSAEDNGKPHTFQAGDVLRIKVYGKKNCEDVSLQKDFPVTSATQTVELFLGEEDTKIGGVISKPKDYWYEIELNPYDNPQTIIGYGEDGPAVFKLFPEGADVPAYVPKPEDIPVIDDEFDMTSDRPLKNKVIARAFANLQGGYQKTHEAVAALHVTPQMFGAIADGVSDDTGALERMLLHGGCILLPEGVYVTNEPLYVNVNTTVFKGNSSRSVIKAGERFPSGEAVVTFYSNNGTFENRRERKKTHGNFSVVGRDMACDGVRIGGKVGTSHEGHVESSIFENILVEGCEAAFLWGAHVYKNTLSQCDSHENKFSLKTSDDITDTGEVFTCINCGFWSGVLYLADCGEIVMNACTIHTKASQTVGGVNCGHYFENALVNFQNCHFEAILRTAAECDEVRPTTFLARNALVYFNECVGVVSGSYMTLGEPMFVDETSNGIGHGIYINGGQWKYYFGRLKVNLLTKGCVDFSNVMLKYMYDGVTFPYSIYEHTKPLGVNRLGGFDYYHGIPKENVDGMTIVERTSGATKYFDITNPKWYQNPAAGFYRKIDVSKYRTCKVKGYYSISDTSYNFTYTDKIANDNGVIEPSVLMFADMYDNYISWGEPYNAGNIYRNGEEVGDVNKLEIEGRAIAIPPGAKYAYIGFDLRHGGGIPSGTITVQSTMTYEFM